jgi:hypothetical protein
MMSTGAPVIAPPLIGAPFIACLPAHA